MCTDYLGSVMAWEEGKQTPGFKVEKETYLSLFTLLKYLDFLPRSFKILEKINVQTAKTFQPKATRNTLQSNKIGFTDS